MVLLANRCSAPWPERLVPICNWGCAVYSCVDCSTSEYLMTVFDPNPHRDVCVDWTDAFVFRRLRVLTLDRAVGTRYGFMGALVRRARPSCRCSCRAGGRRLRGHQTEVQTSRATRSCTNSGTRWGHGQ